MVATTKGTMKKVAPTFRGKAEKHKEFNLFVFTAIIGGKKKIRKLAAVGENKVDIWEAGPFHLCSVLFPVFHLCFICLHCRARLAERLGKIV